MKHGRKQEKKGYLQNADDIDFLFLRKYKLRRNTHFFYQFLDLIISKLY